MALLTCEDCHSDDRRPVQHAVQFERRLGEPKRDFVSPSSQRLFDATGAGTVRRHEGARHHCLHGGFDLGGNQTAIDTLTQCASDPAKFYNAANDGVQLKQAFRDISLSSRRFIFRSDTQFETRETEMSVFAPAQFGPGEYWLPAALIARALGFGRNLKLIGVVWSCHYHALHRHWLVVIPMDRPLRHLEGIKVRADALQKLKRQRSAAAAYAVH